MFLSVLVNSCAFLTRKLQVLKINGIFPEYANFAHVYLYHYQSLMLDFIVRQFSNIIDQNTNKNQNELNTIKILYS